MQREFVRSIVDIAVKATDDVINNAIELIKVEVPDNRLQAVIISSLEDLRSARGCLVHVIRKKICDSLDTTRASEYTKSVVMALLLEMLPFTSEDLIMERRHMAANSGSTPSQPLAAKSDLIFGENSSSTTSDASKNPAKSHYRSLRAMVDEEAEKLGWLFSESTGQEMLQKMVKSMALKDLTSPDRSVPIKYIVEQGLADGTLRPYLRLIKEKTRDTVVGSIIQTGAACRETVEEILANRQKELRNALAARGNDKKQEEEDDRCVAHIMTWGNLVAARAAMDVLREKYLAVVRTNLRHYSVIEAPALDPASIVGSSVP